MVRKYTREQARERLVKYFGNVTNYTERYRMFIRFVEVDARALDLLIEYSGILDEVKGEAHEAE